MCGISATTSTNPGGVTVYYRLTYDPCPGRAPDEWFSNNGETFFIVVWRIEHRF